MCIHYAAARWAGLRFPLGQSSVHSRSAPRGSSSRHPEAGPTASTELRRSRTVPLCMTQKRSSARRTYYLQRTRAPWPRIHLFGPRGLEQVARGDPSSLDQAASGRSRPTRSAGRAARRPHVPTRAVGSRAKRPPSRPRRVTGPSGTSPRASPRGPREPRAKRPPARPGRRDRRGHVPQS